MSAARARFPRARPRAPRRVHRAATARMAGARPATRRGGVLRLATSDDVPTLDPALGYDTTLLVLRAASLRDALHVRRRPRSRPGARRALGALRRRAALHVRPRERPRLLRRHAAHRGGRGRQPRTRPRSEDAARRAPSTTAASGARRSSSPGRASTSRGSRRRTHGRSSSSSSAPDPLFLHKLALMFAAVVPASLARRLGDDFTNAPIGSGPFVLREWRRGERIVLGAQPALSPARPAVPRRRRRADRRQRPAHLADVRERRARRRRAFRRRTSPRSCAIPRAPIRSSTRRRSRPSTSASTARFRRSTTAASARRSTTPSTRPT